MIVKRLLFAVTALLVALSGQVLAQDATTGNVIFIHPDGSGLNHWNTARMYWEGPDGMLAWDMLPYMAIYRGHMFDRLTGTSNGGATVHAFGYKMEAAGSFGRDGDGDAARIINNLAGFGGSIMRQAAAAGYPVGTVNDGQLAEPGTAVFLTEVGNRNEYNEIVRQILDGRPGNEGEAQPQVVMGGGEIYFLPEGTPLCAGELTLDCAAHYDPDEAENVPSRTDGRNLLQEAAAAGYVVIRTRAEFEALKEQLAADPAYAPKVLGIFGADHVFNDSAEEVLIAAGLVREGVMEGDKLGRIILYGTPEGTAGFNPPTAAEMTEVTLTILERKSAEVGLPYFLVTEVESVDNFGNRANAIGTLTALRHADGVIAAARAAVERNPNTLIVTAADSDAGGMQVVSPARTDDAGMVSSNPGNITGDETQDVDFPLDGIEGRGTMPFLAAPDAFGTQHNFAVSWIGTPDVAGAILSRAEGLNAELLVSMFAGSFDSTDVYRIMHLTLFGEMLPASTGERAPDRE